VRRALGIAAVGAAVAVAAALTVGAGGGSDQYSVAAIFDNADFLISGQDVEVAGARVGQVTKVTLTNDRRALVEMEVGRAFAPFRTNADCAIRPQSLIGEKFVECDPGTPDAPVLQAPRGGVPTVPVTHDHSPVDLDLVFTTLRRPLRDRLSIIVNELGTGLAGRPAELNAAIRQANPALEQANRTLAILDSERSTLGRLIDASDTVLRELANRRGDVAGFISHASRVGETVAAHRAGLDAGVRRLPTLLAELEPAANELAGFATDARPVVRALGAAAPQARALLADFQPLANAVRPTLVNLSALSSSGLRAVGALQPVVDLLDPVSRKLPPTVAIAKGLVDSLVSRGVPELLLRFVWLSTAASARFDQVSHVLPSYQLGGTCNTYATTPTAGCSAHFSGTGKGAPQTAAAGASNGSPSSHGARARAAPAGSPTGPTAPGGGVPSGGLARRAASAASRALEQRPGSPPTDPSQLLDWLLRP